MPVGPTDLAHLLLIEYASVYGNDWFVVPIDLPVGSLTRVALAGRHRHLRRPHAAAPDGDPALPAPHVEHVPARADRRSAQAPRGRPLTNLFFLPPTLARPSRARRSRRCCCCATRWPTWRGRSSGGSRARWRPPSNGAGDEIDGAAPDSPPPADAAPLYRLASVVPPHWMPLLPVRVDAEGREVRLARAATLAPAGSRRLVRADGRLLTRPRGPDRAAADPRGGGAARGCRVRRTYQSARWLDGRLVVWAGHRKNVGRGEGSSGLAFDAIVE